MTRLLLALPVLGLLGVLSWLWPPLTRIEVQGTERLGPAAVARLAGLYSGGSWLYTPLGAERRIARHPLVARVRVFRPRLGVVRIEIQERKPFALWENALGFPGARRLGVVLDPEGHPLLLAHAPRRLRGPEPQLEAALRLARAHPRAQEITFDPFGFSLNFGKRRVWLAEANLPVPNPPRGHVYAWGVSVGP